MWLGVTPAPCGVPSPKSQSYVSGSPSGSEEAPPWKSTADPSLPGYGPPAFATGGWLTGATTPAPKAMLSTPSNWSVGEKIRIWVMGTAEVTPQNVPWFVQGAVVDPRSPLAPNTSI